MTKNKNGSEILALNELTGKVHKYNGTCLGGVGSEDNDMPIGIDSCGCDGFEEAAKNDSLTVIKRRHLENGIWQPADCLNNND